MAFKGVLSSQPLPAIAINSIFASSVQYSRLWQFSTLHAMLDGKFIVTFHENVLFLLDPRNGTVLGATAFQSDVKAVVTSGGFLYILCDTLVRVAVHHSYVTMEYETKRILNSTVSTPCTSVGNSPLGSLENLEDVQRKDNFDSQYLNEPSRSEERGTDLTSTTNNVSESVIFPSTTVSIVERGESSPQPLEDYAAAPDPGLECEDLQVDTTASRYASKEELDSPISTCHDEANEKGHFEKCGDQFSEMSSDDNKEASSENIKFGQGLMIDLLKPTLGKLPNLLSPPTPIKPLTSESEESSNKDKDVDTLKEQARHLRMAQAAGDDILADTKSHRKRRKKAVKGKKISSAASKFNNHEFS